jgi:predicted phosphoribosyltransferase
MSETTMEAPLLTDRCEAGRLRAALLEDVRDTDAVVVGLARGGVVTAAEVARG